MQLDELVETARRRTGLHDFSDTDFAGPLRRLLTSCMNEAGFGLIGRMAAPAPAGHALGCAALPAKLAAAAPECLTHDVALPYHGRRRPPPTTFPMAAAKVVGGRSKPGHDTQMVRWVNPFVTWYQT
jgi:hypothetical protein